MLADDPKELLELTRVRDKVAGSGGADAPVGADASARRFPRAPRTSPVTWRCAVSTSGRCRRRWRPGGWPRWAVARAG